MQQLHYYLVYVKMCSRACLYILLEIHKILDPMVEMKSWKTNLHESQLVEMFLLIGWDRWLSTYWVVVENLCSSTSVYAFLSYNELTSSIPLNVWSLENLIFLYLSSNSLCGSLSQNMKIFDAIEHGNLSCNQINVPSIIGAFESLCDLDLSKNLFQGYIPHSFKQVEELDQLDLSNNNLSDVIPKFLETLPYLKYLNLSFNKLLGVRFIWWRFCQLHG